MGSPPTSPAYYQAALDAPDQRPFVVLVDGAVAGGTRYGALTDFSAEIG